MSKKPQTTTYSVSLDGQPIGLPLTDEQVANLREYQACGYVHPYTCCGEDMDVDSRGLHCRKCGRVQTLILGCTADGSVVDFYREVFGESGE